MFMKMETMPNGVAPTRALIGRGDASFQLGAKGGRTAQAWQYVWDRLDREQWRYGLDLAEEAAKKFDLKLTSVTELLSRMRSSGVLEQKMLPIPTTYVRYGKKFVAQRKRVHYRIAASK